MDADSSSVLVGCAVFFLLRGLVMGPFRLLLGGFVESSYSSASEKRSLNLEAEVVWSGPVGGAAGGGGGATYFILCASSQLAWTCCSACKIGVWLKTKKTTLLQSSNEPRAPRLVVADPSAAL